MNITIHNLDKYLLGGIPTPLKNIKVSWDDEIPKIWKNKMLVPNHKPVDSCKNCYTLWLFDIAMKKWPIYR